MRVLAPLLAVMVTATAGAQGALDRARSALAKGDHALARVALLELFDAQLEDRNRSVSEGLQAFRDAGATDTWLVGATMWCEDHPDDAMIQFYRGVTLQDLKHLHRADEALGRALASAPQNPGVQEAWARNAALRFDAPDALDRAAGASFPAVEAFRKEQQARVDAPPKGTVALFALLGAALLGATLWAVRRAGA